MKSGEHVTIIEIKLKFIYFYSFSTPIIALRAQLLINDYITALTSTVRERIQPVALPETQAIVNKLVHTPVTSLRGYGVMIVIRCYDKVL